MVPPLDSREEKAQGGDCDTGSQRDARRNHQRFDQLDDTGNQISAQNVPHDIGNGNSRHQIHQGTDNHLVIMDGPSQRCRKERQPRYQRAAENILEKAVGVKASQHREQEEEHPEKHRRKTG